MLRYLLLSLGQLGDRAVMWVLAKSLAVTLGLFAIGSYATYRILHKLFYDWRGQSAMGLAMAFAAVITLLALWLLFRAVAIAVIGIFADEVVEAVERRHYPAARATARPAPFRRSLGMSIGAAARVGLVNLAMLPVYIALLVTGIGTAAAFLLVNGWLLGRDLTDMVAVRHLDRAGMAAWRRTTGGRRFLLGLTDAILFLIPGVNLFAPVLGAAMATHLFHARRN
jgi:uncharacterized protein involved in cysteine biosynthesis